MTLLGRPPRGLGRKQRMRRDDRLFVIATEDTYAPQQYFDAFRVSRVRIHVVPTTDGRPAVADVVKRLKAVHEDASIRGEIQGDDQFWIVVDTDHYATGHHVATFSNALKEAREFGFRTAVSNPCFELWLLLHVGEPSGPLPDGASVLEALRSVLGAFNKTKIQPDTFIAGVHNAIARAKKLDQGATGWPQSLGTQVHLLVEQFAVPVSPTPNTSLGSAD